VSGLTEELRADHARIFRVLREVLDERVNSAAGHRKLMEARDLIVSHLEREDRELYPLLAEAAAKDPALKKDLDDHLKDILEVSATIRGFFTDHPDTCTDIGCIKDFGTLYMMFKERKDREDRVLFSAYERLVGRGRQLES
jgi:hypothetical protein